MYNMILMRNEFLESLKVEIDSDIEFLKKIQNEIEIHGITEKNVYELTKDLTVEQKQKLSNLYNQQINELKNNINNCKLRILKIKKQL